MTLRIWEIPSYYPNKHMGVYQDPDPGYEDLRFREGRKLENEPVMIFDFCESPPEKLARLGCIWTNIGTPLINQEIQRVLMDIAPDDFQTIGAKIITSTGTTTDYSFLNVSNVCECIDLQASTFYYFDDGAISGAKLLRLKSDASLGSKNLTRLAELTGYIIISQKLYEALSKLKFKGLQFKLDSDGDRFR
jgi:hypothetical protein